MTRIRTLTMIMLWAGLMGTAAAQTVYRWQDDAGTWHFSDSPPAGDGRVESSNYGPYANPPPPDPGLEAILQRQEIARLEREMARLERRQRESERRAAQPQVVVVEREPDYVVGPAVRWRPKRPPGRPGRQDRPDREPVADWTHLPDQNPGLSRVIRQQQRLSSPDG